MRGKKEGKETMMKLRGGEERGKRRDEGKKGRELRERVEGDE